MVTSATELRIMYREGYSVRDVLEATLEYIEDLESQLKKAINIPKNVIKE